MFHFGLFYDHIKYSHGIKDAIIILFIIFAIVLSVFIFIQHSNLQWWNDNAKCTISDDERKDHQPNITGVILASIFMVFIGLTILFLIYKAIYSSGGFSNKPPVSPSIPMTQMTKPPFPSRVPFG